MPGSYDVEWWTPYFIPRPRQWHRSRFMLYGGHVYGSLEIGWTTYSASWGIGSGDVSYEGSGSFAITHEPAVLWAAALSQLTRRLKSALANPTVFNRRVRRLIPLDARTGHMKRKWTWPKGTRPPLSRTELALLETACERGLRSDSWATLTSASYFELVDRAYDSAFPEMKDLTAREKHSSKADSRHGGLLDLPARDERAFREWFESRVWSGTHPWEIVFGHPHGILFSPLLNDDGTWRFHLSVDSPGLFLHAVQMAIALGEKGVPFQLHGKNDVVATLRGVDLVEVGPYYDQLSLARLRETRPDAIDHVRWDAVAEIYPITPVQRSRVNHVVQTGTPAGWTRPNTATTAAPERATTRRMAGG